MCIRDSGEFFLQLAIANDTHSASIPTADCPNLYSVNSTFHSSADSPLLNITSEGKQLTYRSVMRGADHDLWSIAHGKELIKLIIERKTLVPIHQHEQPHDQRRFTTYYNPQVKEKLVNDGNITQRVRGTYGGNKKSAYEGPTSFPTTDISLIKI